MSNMRTWLLALCLAATTISMAQSNDPMVVKTRSGLVKGIDQEGTIAFLGIPYATVERFMPPQPVKKWKGVRVCDHWGPMTMQQQNRPMTEEQMSENCCVLNVWTTDLPKSSLQSKAAKPSAKFKVQSSKLKPVMFWLHGGGFDSGTSEWDPGMCLAKKDVVVVSINHRLNILGFLDLSTVSKKYKYSGNVGMLDAVQALEWVRDNIAQFGGDPNNVTIFGESGGGGKVGTLMCMPKAKGLFHKAIIMSGTILNVNTKKMTEELGEAVLKELGIDKKHIDKIKDVPYKDLYAAGQSAMAASIGTRRPGTPMMWGFGPTPDGEVLLQQPFQPAFASFSDDIPLMIGTTFNELQRSRYGQKMLSIDWLFRPKTIITADAIGGKRKADTYVYMYTVGESDNRGYKGSAHGSELKYCFDVLHHYSDQLSSNTLKTNKYWADTMSSIWAKFAHDGNPNTDGTSLFVAWKPYTKENGELMEIGGLQPTLHHNHDRKLEEIINRHCFKQLDEFRATHQ